MVNPFESVELRLLTIEQLLNELLRDRNTPAKKSGEELIETAEAAKILHLSIDRFYAIHSKTFLNTKKINRRLLFSRKELTEYVESKGLRSIAREAHDAEQYRITRMRKR